VLWGEHQVGAEPEVEARLVNMKRIKNRVLCMHVWRATQLQVPAALETTGERRCKGKRYRDEGQRWAKCRQQNVASKSVEK
jgi:hypothetical protein